MNGYDEPAGSIELSMSATSSKRGVTVGTNPYTLGHKKVDDDEVSTGSIDNEDMDHLHDDRMEPSGAGINGSVLKAPEGDAVEGKKKRSVIVAAVKSFRYLYSLVLLVFSVIVVMAAMFSGQTNASTFGIPSIAAFCIFWFVLIWLGQIEAGQGCLVGLQQIDKERYAESHPVSLKCTTLAHKGDNMERFIVGRQLLVVGIVTTLNMMGAPIAGAAVIGLPSVVNQIFLGNSVAMILTTLMLGQLTAQVNGGTALLDMINNYFMLFSTYVSLAIEFSGLLHSVYLVQIFFSKIKLN